MLWGCDRVWNFSLFFTDCWVSILVNVLFRVSVDKNCWGLIQRVGVVFSVFDRIHGWFLLVMVVFAVDLGRGELGFLLSRFCC